ncbi:hypothetical protein [Bacillus infantis]|uniref:hypothetical protein n=1 Tax=Bacillus infantis TaxID=324767 RepID=UPI003CF6ACA5
MTKILSKIGIKEFKACFESDDVKNMIADMAKGEKTDADVNAIGLTVILDIADIVFANLSSCEEHIYMLLSGLSGMSKKEISELPMATFTAMIIDVIKKDEFKDFIKAVSELLK